MKQVTLFFAWMAFVVSVKAQSIPIGSSLPLGNQLMKDVSGKEVSIKDAFQQNGVLVMFSCNTCPYVIKNQQRTIALASYAKQHGLGVILLNSNEAERSGDDSFEAMVTYAKKQGYQFYYAVDKDSKMADAFGASRTPEVFLFDAKGILQYKGAIDDNPVDASKVTRMHAREAINEMVAGKNVTVKESRSLGCGIKRS